MTDNDPSPLQSARNALAHTILSLKGVGFPKPRPEDVPENLEADDAWQSCAMAALSEPAPGETNGSSGSYVLFCTSDPANSGAVGDKAGLGLNWPYSKDSNMTLVSAPFLDETGRPPKRLFFFDRIDPSAALTDANLDFGLWPKQTPSGAPAPKPHPASNPAAPPPATDTTASNREKSLATRLF